VARHGTRRSFWWRVLLACAITVAGAGGQAQTLDPKALLKPASPSVTQQHSASDLSRYDSLQVIFEPFPGGETPDGFEVTARTLQAEFIDNVRASGKFSVVETPAAGGKVLEARLRIDALNYVHGAARGMLGLMAGRAVLGATLTLKDPQTGAVIDTFRGSDASNHRHGALGATTGRQITAMAKIFSARLVERRTSAPPVAVPEATEPLAAVSTSPVEPSNAGVEIMFWETIRDSKDPADFTAYLEQFPQGAFTGLARSRLAHLSTK
jgi:hypothetical protein